MTIKLLWETLAKENSLYYINSDKGKKITEEQFRESGKKDYEKLVLNDDMIPKHSVIIDLGCGIGRLSEFMAKDFRKVYGVDISGEMIKQGRVRLRNAPNIEFIESDGDNIPLLDNSIDVVFSYLVFQHIKDRDMVSNNFAEVYRVLRSRGIFKVLIRSDKVDINKWWGGVEYTEESIGKLIKSVGFKLLKTEPKDEFGFWLWLRK